MIPDAQATPILPPIAAHPANPTVGPDFYISSLRIIGFRALKDATLCFQPALNVLVGANNSGKTAVIDALRIVLNIGSFQEKEDFIRLKASDICLSGAPGAVAHIVFEATFQGLDTPEIAAQFLEMDANEAGEPGYNLFRLRDAVQFRRAAEGAEYRYVSSQVTGGAKFQNPVSHETLDYIKSIYLAPLRDVVSDGTRLGREVERLLAGHGSPEALAAIPESVRSHAAQLISDATENEHKKAAGRSLAKYASMYAIPEDSIKFMPSGLSEDMLRSLQVVFAHGHHGPDGLGLGSNGLGINNLIYASIVLSRNAKAAATAQKRFLLIEEPEAHLHPQSQETFFQELNSVTSHQIFVTSHSPTITAKCDLGKVIVMGHPIEARKHEPCHVSEVLKGLEADKRYLHKFLDVTRSQLLFANGAIFVEGVTEAMLLQVFSEMLGCGLRAQGVEIVALGSNGGFEHFRRLVGEEGLGMRCAFLTDGDEAPASIPGGKGELVTKTQSPNFVAAGGVRTYRGLGTFEFELLVASLDKPSMQGSLRSVMAAARGAATADVNENFAKDFMDFDNPSLSYRKMKQKKAEEYVPAAEWHGEVKTNSEFKGSKSEFSYLLLQELTNNPRNDFVVPPYIADAIRFVGLPQPAVGAR